MITEINNLKMQNKMTVMVQQQQEKDLTQQLKLSRELLDKIKEDYELL